MKQPETCPVIPHTKKVLSTSAQLRNDMKALRRAMKTCKDCPAGESCEILLRFEHDFKQALYQVTREWGFDVVGEYDF